MELTYKDILEHKGWTDGNPEHPLQSALIWAKPKGWEQSLYVTVNPSPDGTPVVSTPTHTPSIDTIIQKSRIERECDIINASDHYSCDWHHHLISLAFAYAKGPEPKPISAWQRLVAWFYRRKC